jgi:hypothetical protein
MIMDGLVEVVITIITTTIITTITIIITGKIFIKYLNYYF